jgi:hypothetical protein
LLAEQIKEEKKKMYRQSNRTLKLALAVIAAALAMNNIAIAQEQSDTGTFFGPVQRFKAGSTRSYITLENGKPLEIGVRLTEAGLQSALPGKKWQPGMRHHEYHEHIVALPEQARVTPFQFIEVDWNPGGHDPDGVYDKPHFDFHFYTISKRERDAIHPDDPHYAQKAARQPAPEFVPAGYIQPPDSLVPRMGVHWVNSEAEELKGKPFTQTLIQGAWNGRMTFIEPMIAKAYLETKPNVEFPIAQSRCYDPAGLYPTRYGIDYDAQTQEYRIYLSGFEERGCRTKQSQAVTAAK